MQTQETTSKKEEVETQSSRCGMSSCYLALDAKQSRTDRSYNYQPVSQQDKVENSTLYNRVAPHQKIPKAISSLFHSFMRYLAKG
jgi:hypothetical protein